MMSNFLEVMSLVADGKIPGRSELGKLSPDERAIAEKLILRISGNGNARGGPISSADATHDVGLESQLAIQSLSRRVEEKTAELLASKKETEKANERQREAGRLKDEFMANISHELRTPLTSIIGFSRLMLDFPDMEWEERQSYLKIVLGRGQSLEALLNDLIDISRIESNNMPMEIENIGMGDLMAQSVEQFRLMAESKGLKLRLLLDHKSMRLHGDRKKLKQLVNNLIHNAVKYTAEGGSIEVLVKELPHEIMVSVVDTGIGIEKNQHKAIFERFHQVENQKIKAEGTGIGLNLAKLIVRMHRGKIWVESEPNKGSNFSFCIPNKLLCNMDEMPKE